MESVTLHTPLVKEECSFEQKEQSPEEIQTSFELIDRKESVVEEFTVLEQPEEEKVESFRIKQKKKSIEEEFIVLEKPIETPIITDEVYETKEVNYSLISKYKLIKLIILNFKCR